MRDLGSAHHPICDGCWKRSVVRWVTSTGPEGILRILPGHARMRTGAGQYGAGLRSHRATELAVSKWGGATRYR